MAPDNGALRASSHAREANLEKGLVGLILRSHLHLSRPADLHDTRPGTGPGAHVHRVVVLGKVGEVEEDKKPEHIIYPLSHHLSGWRWLAIFESHVFVERSLRYWKGIERCCFFKV